MLRHNLFFIGCSSMNDFYVSFTRGNETVDLGVITANDQIQALRDARICINVEPVTEKNHNRPKIPMNFLSDREAFILTAVYLTQVSTKTKEHTGYDVPKSTLTGMLTSYMHKYNLSIRPDEAKEILEITMEFLRQLPKRLVESQAEALK